MIDQKKFDEAVKEYLSRCSLRVKVETYSNGGIGVDVAIKGPDGNILMDDYDSASVTMK